MKRILVIDDFEVGRETLALIQPRQSANTLEEKTKTAVGEIHAQCAKRQPRFDWKKNGRVRQIRSDEKQLAYILKNVRLAVLAEAKMGSETEINVSQPGALAIASLREGSRMGSVADYLNAHSVRPEDSLLPLRGLLAKHLVEKNGGRFIADQSDAGKDMARMEFPIVEYGKEN